MCKVNYINGEYLDTTTKASAVLGNALHKAMQTYFGGSEEYVISNESEAIKYAQEAGAKYLENFSDGLVEFTSTIPDRAKLNDRFAFALFGFIKELAYDPKKENVLIVEKTLKHIVQVDGKSLPVPIKSKPDRVVENIETKEIYIDDYKFTSKHSDEDTIDASKLVQSAFNYFTVYAETGRKPKAMRFWEMKITENREKDKPQLKVYEIVYDETPLLFDFFYRLYADITDAMMGKQVFIPNFDAMFDKEVSVLAYIHRLDMSEERAKILSEAKVDNITDFLKKKIQTTGAMKKYLEIVNQKFISATTMNYKDMTTQERIKMKLAEHGLGVDYVDTIKGHTVELYRFEPSVGLKMGKLRGYVDDIELVTESSGIRVLAPIPDTNLIGFEIPLKERTFPTKKPKADGFNLAFGVDIQGKTVRMDIRQAPHMLVAGSSGAGKSVFLNSIIKQLIGLDRVDLHLYDPKMVELSQYASKVMDYQDDHLKISEGLQNVVTEMEKRYGEMKKAGVKNIEDMPQYNYKFVIIDEYADLRMRSGTEYNIQLLAQKGRACGIHLVIATQRASTKVISGDIKTNFPTKVVFRMAKAVDSKVMLDEVGAEKLLGKGDMLFSTEQGTQRLQGFNL